MRIVGAEHPNIHLLNNIVDPALDSGYSKGVQSTVVGMTMSTISRNYGTSFRFDSYIWEMMGEELILNEGQKYAPAIAK